MMKIIDLMYKASKGEIINGTIINYNNSKFCYSNGDFIELDYKGAKGTHWLFASEVIDLNNLNDEVEIIEEKKIPEKLPYYSMEKIQKAKNKDEWREERISLLEKRVSDLHIKMNDLIDYLKSKGE